MKNKNNLHENEYLDASTATDSLQSHQNIAIQAGIFAKTISKEDSILLLMNCKVYLEVQEPYLKNVIINTYM